MDFFEEKVAELEKDELGNEINQMLEACDEDFGHLTKEKDLIMNARVEKIERIRLKPANPIVKPGSLLGCQEEVSSEDPFGWNGLNARGRALKSGLSIGDIEEVRLTLNEPKTSTVDSLFEISKRMKKTLLVVGDYIEIVKTTIVTSGTDATNKSVKSGITYDITHYIDVLDADTMYRLPTTLFGPEQEDVWNQNTLNTSELNLREVMEHYKRATLEETLRPLKVVS